MFTKHGRTYMGKINLGNINIDNIKKLDETTLRKDIVIPLLHYIEAKNIMDMHGTNEKGIDIYFESSDLFGHTRRFGIQTKIGNIECTAKKENNNIITIKNQITMAFSNPIHFCTSSKGLEVYIDGFYIITSGKVTYGAADQIKNTKNEHSYVYVIDGSELIDIIKDRDSLKKKNISGISLLNMEEN